jgi:CheY-like chemotaxis protein
LSKPITPSALFEAINGVLNPDGKKPGPAVRPPGRGDREAAAPLWGVKVLVVEDNEINQKVTREILEDAGAAVEIAPNGKAAVEKLSQRSFDVVLMDVWMPEMGGLEATRRIRSTLRLTEVPIIAMTAGASPEERRECLDAGMNYFISKPVDPEKLIGLLVAGACVRNEKGPIEAASFSRPRSPEGVATPFPAEMDVEAALRRVRGNRELLLELMREYGREFANVCDAVRRDLAGGDTSAARERVHALKGASGNLSLVKIHGCAAALEASLRSNDNALWYPLLEKLERSLAPAVLSIHLTGLEPALLQPSARSMTS